MNQVIFPPELNIIQGDEAILQAYESDALYTAMPAALARPKTTQELAAILAFCNQNGISVTPCGNQTSMTGASVSKGGLILSTEKLSKSWRVFEDPNQPGRMLAEVGPAVILSDFQEQLAEAGYFYPPDPTSRREVFLGSTVATNASGEDTYKYGSTRAWVRALEFVKADGEIIWLERPAETRGDGRKNTCGFPLREHDLDLVIGSEGTLGVATKIQVEVLPYVPKFFSILFFLPSEKAALAQVNALHADPAFDLRCLEYMDQGAVAILAEKAAGLTVPSGAAAALYLKLEYQNEADEEQKMEQTAVYLETLYEQLNCPDFIDAVQFAGDETSQQQIRAWRHAIPSTINERAAKFKANGGGKVSTDWYVPLNQLHEMFTQVRLDQQACAFDWVVFGHIGNGHPHFNFVARDAREYQQARDLLLKHCQMAVARGGGVSGEHGLGKLKTHLLGCQYDLAEIEAMLAAKKRFDPNGIMAPGNIFEQLTNVRG